MSLITTQFGQCGNQIGYDLFKCISKDIFPETSIGREDKYGMESKNRWFSTKRSHQNMFFARAVLIDTEQKVVNDMCRKQQNTFGPHSMWSYDKDNIVVPNGGGGAGNNWAYGYGSKGSVLKDNILDVVRKESEKCDRVATILSILSSAGGTGSGVGSYVLERLRDAFPSKNIITAIILPYQSGEVITQNYNTLLTLAKLYDVSDMITVFENDHLHKMSSSLTKVNDVNFSNLNELISLKLASVFQPIEDTSHHISDIVTHLTSHPSFKFVTIKTAPHIAKSNAKYESSFKWNTLLRHIKQTLRVSSIRQELDFDWEVKHPNSSSLNQNSLMQYAHCTANVVITRGQNSADISENVLELNDACMYPKWLPNESRLLHAHHSRKFLDMNNFVTLATNNHLVHYPINEITSKAWDSYKHKAYLHQYTKYGITEDDFLESFSKVESIIKDHKDLGSANFKMQQSSWIQ